MFIFASSDSKLGIYLRIILGLLLFPTHVFVHQEDAIMELTKKHGFYRIEDKMRGFNNGG